MTLRAHDLSARAADRVLFSGLSLELEPGTILAVTGPSGSGKTLLLRQLAALDPLCSGRVTLNGDSPDKLGAPRWRQRVTYLAQDTPPLNGSAAEFFEMVQQFSVWSGRKDPREVARNWGVEPQAWEQRFSTLSGGERQRIFLALGVAAEPAVLLLDEPTSHLDTNNARLVEETLKDLTCVVVTHDEEQSERLGAKRLDLTERMQL
ncbi:MAG: ABC transporter ATP-binding protein [Myxococcota bacterium]